MIFYQKILIQRPSIFFFGALVYRLVLPPANLFASENITSIFKQKHCGRQWSTVVVDLTISVVNKSEFVIKLSPLLRDELLSCLLCQVVQIVNCRIRN